MTDAELRNLCHRFFDAIERRDVAAIAACYAPDLKFWFNVTGTETTREQNLAALADGYARHRRRTYDDRIINTFDGGFIVQYTSTIAPHTGGRVALSACLVAQCKDGQITRIDEYMDSGKFTTAPKKAKAAS